MTREGIGYDCGVIGCRNGGGAGPVGGRVGVWLLGCVG